jgi:predicted transcriptional regulator
MPKKEIAPLTPPQREIMQIIWEYGEVTVSEVRCDLLRKRTLARNTVQTMLVRLEEKGWLKHREEGGKFFYSAAVAKSLSLGSRVAQFVDRFFAGSTDSMVTALLEYRELTGDEADRIRKMIDESVTRSNLKK